MPAAAATAATTTTTTNNSNNTKWEFCIFIVDVELHIVLDPVTTADVQAAIAHTKPSARLLTGKYKQWQQEYESV